MVVPPLMVDDETQRLVEVYRKRDAAVPHLLSIIDAEIHLKVSAQYKFVLLETFTFFSICRKNPRDLSKKLKEALRVP
jgi:hypothetical protein